MSSEATIQRAIQKAIRDRGGYVYKLHGSVYAVSGQPDLIGALDGVSFALEVKLPGGRATAKQFYELEQWRKQGWVSGVVCSVEEALAALYAPRTARDTPSGG